MNKPSKLMRALTAAVLSMLFVSVYGVSNWLAAQQPDLPTWYYGWERFIPLVPWTIVPYMTIDVFFVAAPFLCRTNGELRTLARRIAFGILMAGIFFLVMPLTMAVERPVPEGWTQPIFVFLHGFDQPSNLFPSLHITLRTLLAVHYARHTHGLMRWASNIWFSLIGISTLLTYQHHVVDVLGGFALAVVCIHMFQEGVVTLDQSRRNYRVGSYYATGAILLCVPVLTWWSGGLFLLWPALAFGLAAAAYFSGGGAVYRKFKGQIPLSTKLLFAPVLVGQQLSLLHYRRRTPAWSRVTENVWIGAKLSDREAAELKGLGITAVLDLTSEFSGTRGFLKLVYCNIPLLDLTAPAYKQLKEAADFIAGQAVSGKVYVHCKAGFSRSVAAVGAYLLGTGRAETVQQCIRLIRSVRPGVVVRPEVWSALTDFQRRQSMEGTKERLEPGGLVLQACNGGGESFEAKGF